MELSWTHEAYIFFGTVAGGFVLGIVRDFLKSLKNGRCGKIIFVGITDVIFCVLLSLACFMLIFVLNNGRIRWYEIFGILIGFVIYFFTLSKYILLLMSFIRNVIIKIAILFAKPLMAINIIEKSKKCAETVKNKQKLKFRQIKYIFKKI